VVLGYRGYRYAMRTLAIALAAILSAGQATRPVTIVSEVRAAITAHDLTRAETLVTERRAVEGTTPEIIEAVSWLARGALAEGQRDRAEKYAVEAQKLAIAALGGRSPDVDSHLVAAIGAAIEVQAQMSAESGARSDAIAYLQRELDRYADTSLHKRLQKNINLLTLEGHPAPALDLSESIGPRPPAVSALKGKIVILFFWAHWCPDCKIEGPILAELLAKYHAKGLTVVAPTQRYGYVAGGAPASPEDELKYIVQIRDKYYGFLADLPVPVSVKNHERYGVSSTPTVVILDRQGVVRLYHPGRLTAEELEERIRQLL
jgi:thiol-disulfide isomerase/thioredoxin